MKTLLQSEITRTSMDCCAAHCSIWRDEAGISAPILCNVLIRLLSLIPLRAISARTAFVRGTKLAGCWRAASMGTSSGASSPTKRSPAQRSTGSKHRDWVCSEDDTVQEAYIDLLKCQVINSIAYPLLQKMEKGRTSTVVRPRCSNLYQNVLETPLQVI